MAPCDRGKANTELVAALRQCDGVHAQAVVMVRDDFWMAATSFFDDLETDLILRQNAAAVDLFDPRHAQKVLRALGTVYGKLPERTGDFSRDTECVSGSSYRGSCPRRQDHPRAIVALRRDVERKAVDFRYIAARSVALRV